MKLLNSNPRKIIVLVLITIGVFLAWQAGLQTLHARLLASGTNLVLSTVGSQSRISYQLQEGEPVYQVQVVVEGRRGRFPQKIGALLQPTVMIIAWQLFLLLVMPPPKAFKLLIINMLIFIGLQVLFLLQLVGYYTSDVQKFLYEFFKSSFYVIALVFVFKDNLLNPVFKPGR